jgi:hypothetical protein
MPEIIAGGARAYEDAPREAYERTRGEQARLKECVDPSEQQVVTRELEALEEALGTRQRKVPDRLL